jgi:hypothetical protein
MTSLIFGSIYMGHKGLVARRQEKQRKKNYERWEGLRDEYDEQKKLDRASRSLDIQRTGASGYGYGYGDERDHNPISKRDQQEAGEARTTWRPQESWDDPVDNRRASVEVTAGSGLRPLPSHKTGTTWDEGLPQPLRVSRRNWDDYQPPPSSAAVSRNGSLRNPSGPNTPREPHSGSHTPSTGNGSNNNYSPVPTSSAPVAQSSRVVSAPAPRTTTSLYEDIEPIENAVPGGKMAELIEMGQSHPPQPQHRPAPFTNPPPQSFAGYQSNTYTPQVPLHQTVTQPAPVQEWWNQP